MPMNSEGLPVCSCHNMQWDECPDYVEDAFHPPPKPKNAQCTNCSMAVSVEQTNDCWSVHLNGKYIHHFVYEGDAHGMASRLRHTLAATPKEQ